MTKVRSRRLAMAIAGMWATLTGAAPAHAPGLAALNGLEKGAWELHAREPGGTDINLCLGNPIQLLQVFHAGNQCTRYIIEDEAKVVTVHYSCPGAGHGRTTVRIETARLVQIHTQGIARGAPFSLWMEGRRKGECR
ncbi:hypothetical protein [Rhizorhapis sp. SPR117]|uniref:hypothetical protein n=1 Tax=Rhizorhapis sp. SPR117 TaxID=2912611 RepID=UPI001F2CFF43|nr:hypothetical protein [Rhizorhapis sp. SPR117]